MQTSLQILNNIRIATPCPASWSKMAGDHRTRFCGECQKNVYNISEMKADDAVALICEKEGKLCLRLYRRQDGTVLTADCPAGRRLLRKSAARLASAIVATFALLVWVTTALANPWPRMRLTKADQFYFAKKLADTAHRIRFWVGPKNKNVEVWMGGGGKFDDEFSNLIQETIDFQAYVKYAKSLEQ